MSSVFLTPTKEVTNRARLRRVGAGFPAVLTPYMPMWESNLRKSILPEMRADVFSMTPNCVRSAETMWRL